MAGSIQVDGDVWRALQAPEDPEAEHPEVAVTWRTVALSPLEEEVQFEARWRVVPGEPRWFESRLAGPGVHLTEATFNGAPMPVEERDTGPWTAMWLEKPGLMVVRGVAAGDARQGPVSLDLLEAAAGDVSVDWDKPADVNVYGAAVPVGEQFWTGAGGLSIGVGSDVQRSERGTLVVADAGLGLTVGEGAWNASARLRWEVRQGEVSEVAFRIDGTAADLEVTGPSVAEWHRSGDRVVVKLLKPEDRLVRLEATWSGAVPKGDTAKLPVPSIRPEAFRVNASLQLARDGDLEVIPSLSGWESIPHSALPEWGKDLTMGAASASYTASKAASGQVELVRFTPVSGPPTFVDVATITAASTADGRVLMRAHYAVRNDRAAHLRITPPVGAKVVGARVAGDTASVGVDGDTWLIPLEKSVETVEGLLSFPVEVTLLLDEAPWLRREKREVAIPRVNAPVAVMRATLHLPPGFHNQLQDGDGDLVSDFTEGEGISYGSGSGQSAAAEVAMQNAVSAWMDNDFDAAQGYLEDLEELDAFDSNAQRLQSNLNVISGEEEGQYDVAMERRVKEQAKARAYKDVAKQEAVLKKAEEASLSGDYAAAESAYREALDLGGKLDNLEQSESVEVSTKNVVLREKMKEAKKSEVAVETTTATLSGKRNRNKSGASEEKERAEFHFDDDEITGNFGTIGTGRGGGGQGLGGLSGGDSGGEGFGRGAGSLNGDGGVVQLEDRVTVDKSQILIGTPDASNAPAGTLFTDEVLSQVPAGRSYQSAITVTDEEIPEELSRVLISSDESDFRYMPEGATINAPEPEPVMSVSEVMLDMPTSRSNRGGRGKMPSFGKSKTSPDTTVAQAPPPPPMAAPKPAPARGPVTNDRRSAGADKGWAEDSPVDFKTEPHPAVRAVALSVVIPNQGETVRFEHMLLPENAFYSLDIDARTKRRDP